MSETHGPNGEEDVDMEIGIDYNGGMNDDAMPQTPSTDDEARFVSRLADFIIAQESFDDLELLALLKPMITIDNFTELCEALERCHIHLCDDQICADDLDPSCPSGRAAIAHRNKEN